MSGFPTRIDRNALGPVPENRFPVRDPKRELDGPTIGDLMMWQIAGSGLLVPRTRVHFTMIAGPAAQLDASAEAWDPNGVVLPAVAARIGVGLYQVRYAATGLDKDGVPVTIVLDGAGATVAVGSLGGNPPFVADAFLEASKRDITVRVYDNTDALTDPPIGSQLNVWAW